jgi:hypothetical protein
MELDSQFYLCVELELDQDNSKLFFKPKTKGFFF